MKQKLKKVEGPRGTTVPTQLIFSTFYFVPLILVAVQSILYIIDADVSS
jgi:hypothetical protein